MCIFVYNETERGRERNISASVSQPPQEKEHCPYHLKLFVHGYIIGHNIVIPKDTLL